MEAEDFEKANRENEARVRNAKQQEKVETLKAEVKANNPRTIIGESVSAIGKVSLDIVKTGAMFMAFYLIWAYLGVGLLPMVFGGLAIGLAIWYIGRGIAGYGWNPMEQGANRLNHQTRDGFVLNV